VKENRMFEIHTLRTIATCLAFMAGGFSIGYEWGRFDGIREHRAAQDAADTDFLAGRNNGKSNPRPKDWKTHKVL
jgi:hypothetical protein